MIMFFDRILRLRFIKLIFSQLIIQYLFINLWLIQFLFSIIFLQSYHFYLCKYNYQTIIKFYLIFKHITIAKQQNCISLKKSIDTKSTTVTYKFMKLSFISKNELFSRLYYKKLQTIFHISFDYFTSLTM